MRSNVLVAALLGCVAIFFFSEMTPLGAQSGCLQCHYGWTPPVTRTGNVLTVDISLDWMDPPIQQPGSFVLNQVIENATDCAIAKWNAATGTGGAHIPFQFVRFDPTQHPSPPDVTVEVISPMSMTLGARAKMTGPDPMNPNDRVDLPGSHLNMTPENAELTDPSDPAFGTDNGQDADDVCGRVAHELFHKLGYQKIPNVNTTCNWQVFSSIGEGTVDLGNGTNAGARFWNDVQPVDVDLVNLATSSPSSCTGTGSYGDEAYARDGGGGGGGGGGEEGGGEGGGDPQYPDWVYTDGDMYLQYPYCSPWGEGGCWPNVCMDGWVFRYWYVHLGGGNYEYHSFEVLQWLGNWGCMTYDGDTGSNYGVPWIWEYFPEWNPYGGG